MSLWPFGETLSHSGIDSILEEYYLIFRSLEGNETSSTDDKKNEPSMESESEFGTESRDRSDLNQSFIDRILLETALLDELNGGANDRLVDFICLGYFYDDRSQQVRHMDYLVGMLMAYLKDIDRTGYRTPFLLENSFHQTGEYEDQDDEDPMLYVNIISSIFCSKSAPIVEALVQNTHFCPLCSRFSSLKILRQKIVLSWLFSLRLMKLFCLNRHLAIWNFSNRNRTLWTSSYIILKSHPWLNFSLKSC